MVAGPIPARLRVAQAFADRSDLTTHSVPSIGHLLSLGGTGAHQLLVACCDRISSEDVGVFSQLKRQSPELLIVAVCGCADRRSVRRLIDSGVDALVLFDQLDKALAPTVAAVFAGQMVVPREMRASVDKPALSSRERQILAMVVMGLTNHEISSRMFLAESTVKSHLSSAYNKLGVRSRSEAAALILDGNRSLATDVAAAAPDAGLRAV